jgi:TetR/AcrR family transcriptional repressor of mexJK operon
MNAPTGESAAGTDDGEVAAVIKAFTGRLNPRPKEQEVLEVAAEYFLKHGYEGASINAMARSSGISKESIYRYFSSKKQLFEAVIGRELVDYQAKLERLDPALESMDLRDGLCTIGETVLGVITSDRTLALRRLIFEEATRSPDVGQHYFKVGPEQAMRSIERLFRTHPHESEFDVHTLSMHFMALMSWRFMLERECAVRRNATRADVKLWVTGTVDDFLKAFIRNA